MRVMDRYMADTPLILAEADVQTSSEAVDGNHCAVSVGWEASRVHEVWVSSRFIMPSGRTYRIIELRWTVDDDNYTVHIKGERAE